ncbi:MAG: hypothetical protein LBS41_02430 [Streptococcaceae bacterium]|jgi:hypothetical protein|nr:hypothetical protein [Streptococcaceae bacterium]
MEIIISLLTFVVLTLIGKVYHLGKLKNKPVYFGIIILSVLLCLTFIVGLFPKNPIAFAIMLGGFGGTVSTIQKSMVKRAIQEHSQSHGAQQMRQKTRWYDR